MSEFEEYNKWAAEPEPTKKLDEALAALLSNNRRAGQAERYHFLPGAWDMPAVVVDFGELEYIPVSVLKAAPCQATIASPFAESMAARLVRYLGRLGTPDLDLSIVLKSLRSASGHA